MTPPKSGHNNLGFIYDDFTIRALLRHKNTLWSWVNGEERFCGFSQNWAIYRFRGLWFQTAKMLNKRMAQPLFIGIFKKLKKIQENRVQCTLYYTYMVCTHTRFDTLASKPFCLSISIGFLILGSPPLLQNYSPRPPPLVHIFTPRPPLGKKLQKIHHQNKFFHICYIYI